MQAITDMVVKTFFRQEGVLVFGEVEIKLLPGIPILHVVGLPDSHIRECGTKLKSALKSCEFEWPRGHQIVVNLRPSYFRKSSCGIDLAVALGFLALTKQLSESVQAQLNRSVVYGEVALNGRIFAPPDLAAALRVAREVPLITGEAPATIREGEWLKLNSLDDTAPTPITRSFCWNSFWRTPEMPNLMLHRDAVQALILAVHMGLNVLVAGPQGSGKTSWARALYTLTPPPNKRRMDELHDMFGESVYQSGWRPFENPHHSITPQAMIGGGAPLVPGVISRSHGGVLVMDEFLEFHPQVLEALREPIESGYVDHARRGEQSRFPASFQLIATTNLCFCGKLIPNTRRNCPYSLVRCRSVCARLSGPIVDRFDLVEFSHTWLENGSRQQLHEARSTLAAMSSFAEFRGPIKQDIPDWLLELKLSHRRHRALLRVARGLADMAESNTITSEHFRQAYAKVIDPIHTIAQLFA